MASNESEPCINDNPTLQSYYASLESRVGYRLLLGGTRHFGYYDSATSWPLPVGPALRRMEARLLEALSLPAGSRLLDAGCGMGHVALFMAENGGHLVKGIDVVAKHVEQARQTIAQAEADGRIRPGQMTAQLMDYHHLEALADASLDGIYTMETLVHATDPEAVLAGFFRVLRPGGRVVLFEYDNVLGQAQSQEKKDKNQALNQENNQNNQEKTALPPQDLAHSMQQVNLYSAMPTNARANPGLYQDLLQQAGFVDVVVRDQSANIRPMLRLFWALALVPYYLVWLLGLERYFINTVAGYQAYRGHKYWRHLAVSATKPGSHPKDTPEK